jgi:hypothetical protein
MKLYAISYFELESEGLIKSATEYWADTYEPPNAEKILCSDFYKRLSHGVKWRRKVK